MGFFVMEGVSKRFGDIPAVDNVSLTVQKGEIFSLLGPSGCGKTTLLRICAGFEAPDAGRVILDGHDITNLPPDKRQVNTVFQSYALFPHLSVYDNIAFGLRLARRPESEVRVEVDRFLDLLQMADHQKKRPNELSGGQKQRVAIARALVNRPQVLLLDEPLAALDLKLRQRILVELDDIHDEVGTTFLYVTHDQGEAMSLSDHIAVMNKGGIEQVGTPVEIYEAPRSSFVAAFIGDTNFLDAVVCKVVEGEYCLMRADGLPFDMLAFNDKQLREGDLVHLSVRPEKLNITLDPPPTSPRHNVLEGEVEEVVYLGSHTRFWVRVGEYRLTVSRQHDHYLLDHKRITWKDHVWLSWNADDGYMLERYQESDEALLSLPPEEAREVESDADS